MNKPSSIPGSEKGWIAALGGISVLYVLYRLFLAEDHTLDLHFHDTYYILEGGKWGMPVVLWAVYFFHLGLQTMAGWSRKWKMGAIAALTVTVILHATVFKYFYNSYMMPSAFDWPLEDDEARKILLKQQEILKQAFMQIAVPVLLLLAMHLVRLGQLFFSKPFHADTGLPTT